MADNEQGAGTQLPVLAGAAAALPSNPYLEGIARLPIPRQIGVIIGLVIGKPIGVTGTAWLVAHFTRARLSSSLRWRDVFAVGLLAGIGFTVSLFITELAFTDPDTAAAAKLAILVASLAAAMAGAAAVKSSAVELRGE